MDQDLNVRAKTIKHLKENVVVVGGGWVGGAGRGVFMTLDFAMGP